MGFLGALAVVYYGVETQWMSDFFKYSTRENVKPRPARTLEGGR